MRLVLTRVRTSLITRELGSLGLCSAQLFLRYGRAIARDYLIAAELR
jgi:hypothetical protein